MAGYTVATARLVNADVNFIIAGAPRANLNGSVSLSLYMFHLSTQSTLRPEQIVWLLGQPGVDRWCINVDKTINGRSTKQINEFWIILFRGLSLSILLELLWIKFYNLTYYVTYDVYEYWINVFLVTLQ